MEPRKYTRKEIKERKRLGYYPLSAAEQVLYIIIYKVKHDLRSLRLRFKLCESRKRIVTIVAYGVNTLSNAARNWR